MRIIQVSLKRELCVIQRIVPIAPEFTVCNVMAPETSCSFFVSCNLLVITLLFQIVGLQMPLPERAQMKVSLNIVERDFHMRY